MISLKSYIEQQSCVCVMVAILTSFKSDLIFSFLFLVFFFFLKMLFLASHFSIIWSGYLGQGSPTPVWGPRYLVVGQMYFSLTHLHHINRIQS